MAHETSAQFFQNLLEDAQLQRRVNTREKDGDDPRGVYFRDATAILHATPFRRLKHKTQVFFAPSNDHICTRLEHVLHVSSIAVTICRALGLNTDLAWAIGMGHDLGHTPFGHLGESVLQRLSGQNFCHELHSLRVVDVLSPLNLSYAVRDGIITHCGEKFEQVIEPTQVVQAIEGFDDREAYPSTYEGCVIRMADKIAYLGRDYEDAVKLGIVEGDALPLPIVHALGSPSNSDSINTLTRDLIEHARAHGSIGFSAPVYEAMCLFKTFNYTCIYHSDYLKKQGRQCEKLLSIVYEHVFETITRHKDDFEAYEASEYEVDATLAKHLRGHSMLYRLSDAQSRTQAVVDFIAGMTDDFLISAAQGILFPTNTRW